MRERKKETEGKERERKRDEMETRVEGKEETRESLHLGRERDGGYQSVRERYMCSFGSW